MPCVFPLFCLQAVPWAATVANKVQELRYRDVRAEEELERVRRERDTSDEQAKSLATDKKNLLDDVDALHQRVSRRNSTLKNSQKELCKTVKKLELTEERCFQMGYDEAVLKVHAQGWATKLF